MSISRLEAARFFLLIRAIRGLLVEHLLHVTDFTLHLPACFFHRAAITQVWIPCSLARLFFGFAFRLPESALNLILRARFHKKEIARYERGGCNDLDSAIGDGEANGWNRTAPLNVSDNCHRIRGRPE